MADTSPPPRQVLTLQTLTAAAFAPFGQVIDAASAAAPVPINDGFAQRFDSPAQLHTSQQGGAARVSIYRVRARELPLKLSVMERHLLGSQLFMPLAPLNWVLVVAAAGPAPDVSQARQLRAFQAGPGQGVNLAPGTWHHPLLALDAGEFLVLDRLPPGALEDCELLSLATANVWLQG